MKLALPLAHLVPCHRRADRSFFLGKTQFPVCARCTGISVGYLAYPLFLLGWWQIGLFLCLSMQIPLVFDGYTQYREWRESTNVLRFMTGVLSGIGQAGIMVMVGRFFAVLLLS